MSGENKNREQAQNLLRAIGEIDDRFLMEALKAQAGAADTSVSDSAGSGSSVPESPAPDSSLSGEPKTRRSLFRKYSRWALTAAACLTVVVVGRFVSVNTVKNGSAKYPAVSDQAKESENMPVAELDEEAGNAAAPEAAADAEEAPAAAVQEIQEDSVGDFAGAAEEAQEVPAAAAEEADEEMIEDADMMMSMEPAENAAEPEAAEPVDDAARSAENAAGETAGAQRETFSSKGAEAAGMGASMLMPNPFADLQTLEEAQEEAGFAISLPEAEEPYDTLIYRAIKGQMIEIIYLDDRNHEGYRIRKGINMEEDISGDYNEYAKEDTLEAGGLTIQVRGEKEDQWSTAVWTENAQDGALYSYAVCADGKKFSSEEIISLAEAMTASQ